ncbi:hypothetical protein H4R34_002073 [Dimargaris verticillata]|uniref:Probable RNA polymerase II nuclear localization protein SLC7A6OS n=1 Tax=Dimargaris verticillata TaxID=2761393 RepID=A0A9W8B8N8_9FUNG|nr:hypothetical protein H4R34_002073 [Dimargaris verticillata]
MPELHAGASKPLTILRIKRKRTEEPLDALKVESGINVDDKRIKSHSTDTEKKSPGTEADMPRLFRLAETVDIQTFDDQEQTKLLQAKIHRLANRHLSARFEKPENLPTGINEIIDQKKAKIASDKKSDARNARFRVVNRNRTPVINQSPEAIAAKLKGASDGPSVSELFHLVDAVKDSQISPSSLPRPGQPSSSATDSLIPMMEQYLSVDQTSDDYVYDVYYVDTADDDEFDVIRAQKTYGSLLWTGVEDDNYEFVPTSESECDEEDSNAEDYYAHDYPDEDDWSDEDRRE